MVRNTVGGNKQKGQARKNAIAKNNFIRLSESDEEKYAMVTRLYGGKLCEVITDNDIKLKCVIRGKFSGKFKRSNTISAGSIVLVGMRDWEAEATTCDLLEVYDLNDVQYIRTLPNVNFKFCDGATTGQTDEMFSNAPIAPQFVPDEEDMNQTSECNIAEDVDLDLI